MSKYPVSITAAEAPLRLKPSNYPEPFFSRMAGRLKRPLGDLFGLANFGVNLTALRRGGLGAPSCPFEAGRVRLYPRRLPDSAARRGPRRAVARRLRRLLSSTGEGHCLINETDADVTYLEIGDRSPDDDLMAVMVDGKWRFAHKDGSPY